MIDQFTYRALYGVSKTGRTSFAIVRTGAYVPYGFGGFIYSRNGGVVLPTSGQAKYTGTYAGLRDFNNQGGMQITSGNMQMSIDFNDFNAAESSTGNGAGIQGYVTNRKVFDLAGNDITAQVLAGINADKNPNAPLTALPTLIFKVGPGVLDNNGEAEGQVSNTITSNGTPQVFESGKYYAVISGNNADEVAGVIVVTSTIASIQTRETGGFILYRPVRRVLAATVAAALWAGAATAGPATLTADQMRAFGLDALAHGFADQALGVAEALLVRDPGDSAALALKSQALRVKGDLKGSEAAARAAWAVAKGAGARFAAATALAQALSLQDHRTMAQYWLRQAVQNAPNDAARAQAVQDFDYVRSQNPLSLQIDASIRPSTNVNGGSKIEFVQIGPFILPLPSTLQVLSGTTWALGLSGQYKLSDNGATQNALTFGAQLQGVNLSSAAKAKAPDLSNADFAYQQVQFGFRNQITADTNHLTTEFDLGHSWYGGRDLANSATLNLTLEHPWSTTVDSSGAFNLTRQQRVDGSTASSTALGWTASVVKTGHNGDAWQAELDLTHVLSADIGTEQTEQTVSLGWQAAHPVAGFTFGATGSVHHGLYANLREDWRYAAGLTARIDRITYLGFSPVVSFDVAHNESTVPWFTSDTVAVGISLKSRF